MSELEQAEKKAKRARGTGMIYQPSNSRFLWLKYYDNGVCHRESTRTTDTRKTEKLLRTRLASIDSGTFAGPTIEKTDVKELGEDFLRDYRISSKRALAWAERRWFKHVEPYFGSMRASRVTTGDINAYVEKRKTEGASNASINRELACLRRAFNLALRNTPPKVQRVPSFPRLEESAPRAGFLDSEQYRKMLEQNPPCWFRGMISLAYGFGFRRGELLNMRVSQFDLLNRTIRLNPGSTKNREGRLVHYEGAEIEMVLTECIRGKGPDDFLFSRESGEPVRDFRGTWWALCAKAGLGRLTCPRCVKPVDAENHCPECGKTWKPKQLKYSGLIFHDLRRSAVRNMVRRGIPERVAMAISGHKTRSVFDRYNIVSEDDLKEAAKKISGQPAEYAQVGHSTGTGEPSERLTQ